MHSSALNLGSLLVFWIQLGLCVPYPVSSRSDQDRDEISPPEMLIASVVQVRAEPSSLPKRHTFRLYPKRPGKQSMHTALVHQVAMALVLQLCRQFEITTGTTLRTKYFSCSPGRQAGHCQIIGYCWSSVPLLVRIAGTAEKAASGPYLHEPFAGEKGGYGLSRVFLINNSSLRPHFWFLRFNPFLFLLHWA